MLFRQYVIKATANHYIFRHGSLLVFKERNISQATKKFPSFFKRGILILSLSQHCCGFQLKTRHFMTAPLTIVTDSLGRWSECWTWAAEIKSKIEICNRLSWGHTGAQAESESEQWSINKCKSETKENMENIALKATGKLGCEGWQDNLERVIHNYWQVAFKKSRETKPRLEVKLLKLKSVISN